MSSPASNLVQLQAANSGIAQFSLLDIVTLAGNGYFFADVAGLYPAAVTVVLPESHPSIASASTAGALQQYLPWVLSSGFFHLMRSLQKDTGSISLQNISGNSLARDMAALVALDEFVGAEFVYRLWRADSEQPLFTFVGEISSVQPQEQQITLQIKSWFDPNTIDAMPFVSSSNCQWRFANAMCGSTSGTPCNLTLATCSAVERFSGIVNSVVSTPVSTTVESSAKRRNFRRQF